MECGPHWFVSQVEVTGGLEPRRILCDTELLLAQEVHTQCARARKKQMVAV